MNEQRKICAELCNKDRNCPYAKIVKEKGLYPVTTFSTKIKDGDPDFTTVHNVKERVDTTCFCVYCTHPSYSEEKLIGSVEPYFSCDAPSDCPELHKESDCADKASIWQWVKNFFKK